MKNFEINKARRLFSVVVVLISLTSVRAQEFQLYSLDNVSQRNKLNPAFTSNAPVYAGFPLTSSIMASYQNNGFKYSDLIKKDQNDSLYFDFENAINEMNSQNLIHSEVANDLLMVGANIGENTITFNITEKAFLDFAYSKSMIEFIYYGNGGYNGNTGTLNPQIEGSHTREYSLAWARKITPQLTVGTRIKYLYGMEHIHSSGLGVTLYTDPDDYTLYGYSDYSVYTSGLTNGSFDNVSMGEYLFNKKNTGYGFDLGMVINTGEKGELSISMVDIGKIKWSEDVTIYETKTTQGPVVYQGIKLDDFINNGQSSSTLIENLGDSLYEGFNVEEKYESFTRPLPKQYYTGFTYKTGLKSKAGIIVHVREAPSKHVISYHAHYSSSVKDWLSFSLGYSSINGNQGNIGGSFAFNFRGGQMYFAADNLIGMVNYKKANVTGFRAGFNFIFSGKKKPEEDIATSSENSIAVPATETQHVQE